MEKTKSEGEILIEKYLERVDESKEKMISWLYQKEIDDLVEQAEASFDAGDGGNCIVYTRSKEIASIALDILQQRITSRTYGKDKRTKIIPITINPLIIKDEDKMFAQIQEELKDVWSIPERTRESGLATLRETLRAVPDIGVLIILEELEANVIGKKQGLLYGLFDLQHYDSIKLFSVLVAQNIGIVDHFEKRVKSRYSHRFFFYLIHRHVFLYKVDFNFFTKAFDYILNIESDTKLHNVLVLYYYLLVQPITIHGSNE